MTGAGMTRAQQFEQLRPLLFAIAYRILGSVSEAEDAVQETWLRWESSPTAPASTKAFLSAVVTRISIDVLRSARVRREEYVGPWFPEPLLTDPYEDPEHSAELADSLSMAALLLLERLTPLERAVFVLREVFGFAFPEIASAVGRSEAACRQLAVRARRHMQAGRPRFEADRREREELAERFFDAFRDAAEDPVGDREQQGPQLLELLGPVHPSSSENPSRHDGYRSSHPRSRFAFALEKPRPWVITPTAISPAIGLANHAGTRRGGLAPARSAR